MSGIGLAALLLAAPGAGADELRNVKTGEVVPEFTVRTLSGDELRSADLVDNVVILLYIAAEQRSSILALQEAEAVVRELDEPDLALVSLTADVARVDYFRAERDRLDIHHPMGLDVARRVQGALGLFVYPTTIVIDREGRLAHVISSRKSDYAHVLGAYARHALGALDDAGLEEELTARTIERNRPEDLAARHRSAARILRERGLPADAVDELKRALEILPADTDTMLDLASTYIALERFGDAEPLVSRLAAMDPEPRRNKLLRGVVLYHHDQVDEAEVVLREALLLNPDPVWTHYYLGLIAERRGDAAAAAEHFRESVSRLLKHRPM